MADLHRAYPQIPILVLSTSSEDQYAARSLRAGAAGYLGKGVDRHELIRAIKTVLSGERYISPLIAQRIALEKVLPAGSGPLSNREYEILRGIAAGRTMTDIARELALSIKTVSTYKRRIMGKLGVTNNAELIRRAIDDATTSASAYQLYTCTLVGQPQVFESTNDPNFGHVFRAEATVSCTP